MSNLTKVDREILLRAAAETRRVWEQSIRNYGVFARAEPGAWPTEPATAKRLQDQLTKRLAKLDAAVLKIENP